MEILLLVSTCLFELPPKAVQGSKMLVSGRAELINSRNGILSLQTCGQSFPQCVTCTGRKEPLSFQFFCDRNHLNNSSELRDLAGETSGLGVLAQLRLGFFLQR